MRKLPLSRKAGRQIPHVPMGHFTRRPGGSVCGVCCLIQLSGYLRFAMRSRKSAQLKRPTVWCQLAGAPSGRPHFGSLVTLSPEVRGASTRRASLSRSFDRRLVCLHACGFQLAEPQMPSQPPTPTATNYLSRFQKYRQASRLWSQFGALNLWVAI